MSCKHAAFILRAISWTFLSGPHGGTAEDGRFESLIDLVSLASDRLGTDFWEMACLATEDFLREGLLFRAAQHSSWLNKDSPEATMVETFLTHMNREEGKSFGPSVGT